MALQVQRTRYEYWPVRRLCRHSRGTATTRVHFHTAKEERGPEKVLAGRHLWRPSFMLKTVICPSPLFHMRPVNLHRHQSLGTWPGLLFGASVSFTDHQARNFFSLLSLTSSFDLPCQLHLQRKGYLVKIFSRILWYPHSLHFKASLSD